jgi:Alternative complex III, ActD subunit
MNALLAEYDDPRALLRAAREARALGYAKLEAFTPFELPELDEVLRPARPKLPRFVAAAALAGVVFAYLVIRYCNAMDYPLDVGGRPLDAIPADVPIAFETAILFAATTAFARVLLGAGLPRLWHPVFEVEGFERASIDRFFLGIDAAAAITDGRLHEALRASGALRIENVGGVG